MRFKLLEVAGAQLQGFIQSTCMAHCQNTDVQICKIKFPKLQSKENSAYQAQTIIPLSY